MLRQLGVTVFAGTLACCAQLALATARPGGNPACERIIWSDSFDFYNQWAWDNRENPAYSRGTVWQGGPIPPGAVDPDSTPLRCDLWPQKAPSSGCGTTQQTSPAAHQMARAQWVRAMNCGSITTPGGLSSDSGEFQAVIDPNCGVSGEIATIRGQYAVASYTWGTGNSYNSMQMFVHSFKERIQLIDPTKNAVNGTDEKPLVLIFDLHDGLSPFKDNSYVELSLSTPDAPGGDHAPTDYVWRGDPTKTYPDPTGCPNGPFPVICQQAREINSSGSEDGSDLTWLNNNCPPLVEPYDPVSGTGRTWKSIAFGFVAITDKDPCGILEQGGDPHVPNIDHFTFFDGNKWRQLRSNRGFSDNPPITGLMPGYNQWDYPPDHPTAPGTGKGGYDPNMHINPAAGSSNFSYGAGTNRVYMKIMTNYVLIFQSNPKAAEANRENVAAIPRVYKGPFNTISWGVAPGCELDPTTYQCKAGAPTQCLTYSRISAGYNRTIIDSMAIYDGELDYVSDDGACCRPTGECVVESSLACAADGGNFGGTGSTECRNCCPRGQWLWADADVDGDIDHDDYGKFQACFTGGALPVPAGCECLDRVPGDGINGADFTAFKACVTGPSVPYNTANLPAGCTQ